MKQWPVLILILLWLGWHLAIPVDLIQADVGRHIKNGELILNGNRDVLYKNFYSYTVPECPFINHHWLFGVFCYVLWHFFGFTGLSIIYLALELLTFYIFICCCRRYSSFALTCAFGLLSFPFLVSRTEIRPEQFSYLFCGLFWWLISSYQQKRLSPGRLTAGLCLLQVIWVNTHIFFIMGPLLTAIFWLQARANGEEQEANVLQKLFLLLLAMCLINPSGINGFLAAFQVNKAYSVSIGENQSVFFYLNSKSLPERTFYLYFLASFGMLAAGLVFLVQREGFKKHIFIGILSLLLSLAAIRAVRMIGLYGLFWIPMASYVYGRWIEEEKAQVKKGIEILLVALAIMISASINFDWKYKYGLGLAPGTDDAAKFFKREGIKGVIFNDYDIGGYLIFYFSPQYKFFVDNRMEAFPEDFFKKTYIPVMSKDEDWHQAQEKYHFNVIFITPEQNPLVYRFLRERLQDHSWALVFVSDKAIIFLKRNQQNSEIIKRNEKHVRI